MNLAIKNVAKHWLKLGKILIFDLITEKNKDIPDGIKGRMLLSEDPVRGKIKVFAGKVLINFMSR